MGRKGASKPIVVGFVGLKLCGSLTLVLVLEATSKVLGLGLARVFVARGELPSGIPAGLCGLRPLVLVLVLLNSQLEVSSPLLFIFRIKIRLPDPLADRLLAILQIGHKLRRPPETFGRATPAAAKGITGQWLNLEAQRGIQVFVGDPSGSGRGPSGPQFAHLVVLRRGVVVARLVANTVSEAVCSSNLFALMVIRTGLTRQWQDVFLGEGVNYIDEKLGAIVDGVVSARVHLDPVLQISSVGERRLEDDRQVVDGCQIREVMTDLSDEILISGRACDHNGPGSEGEVNSWCHLDGCFG